MPKKVSFIYNGEYIITNRIFVLLNTEDIKGALVYKILDYKIIVDAKLLDRDIHYDLDDCAKLKVKQLKLVAESGSGRKYYKNIKDNFYNVTFSSIRNYIRNTNLKQIEEIFNEK